MNERPSAGSGTSWQNPMITGDHAMSHPIDYLEVIIVLLPVVFAAISLPILTRFLIR
jgi:hypothetical protein